MSSQLGIAPSAIKLSADQVKKTAREQPEEQRQHLWCNGAQAAYPAHPPAQRGQKCMSVRDRWSCGSHSPTLSSVPQTRHSKRRPRAESKETSLLCLPILTGLIWPVWCCSKDPFRTALRGCQAP